MCRTELYSTPYNKSLCLYFLPITIKGEYIILDGYDISIVIPENYEEHELYEASEKTCFKQYWIINLLLPAPFFFSSPLSSAVCRTWVLPSAMLHWHFSFAPLALWRTWGVSPLTNVCRCKFSFRVCFIFSQYLKGLQFCSYFENAFWFCRVSRGKYFCSWFH